MPKPVDRAARSRSFSAAVEDYLKAIFRLEELLKGPVSTNALAESLDVRAASISGMLGKLDDLGLVDHVAYRGVSLSPEGRRAAVSVIRRHRLLELFLAEILDVPWDEVHEEAEVLEHALSPRLCDLIANKLGNPERDPHGDPIPGRIDDFVEPPTAPLASTEIGATRHLVRVSDRDSWILRALSASGIGLGTELVVLAHLDDGSISVAANGRICTLEPDVVSAIRVET
jgi:DtxR family Mn-dependent transcriptional regulator